MPLTEKNEFQIFRFSSERQKQLYNKLKLISPDAVAFYKNAYQLLATDPLLESTTHLVGHLFREIESSIRKVLVGFLVTEPRPKNSGNSHVWEIQKILEGLGASFDHPIAAEWLNIPRSEFALDKLAHRENLSPPRPFDQNYIDFLSRMDSIFSFLTDSFEARYLDSQKPLEKFLKEMSPSEEDAKWLKIHLPNNPVTMRYFFEGIITEKWLPLLEREGFFNHPPEPELEYDRDNRSYFNHSIWAQSFLDTFYFQMLNNI